MEAKFYGWVGRMPSASVQRGRTAPCYHTDVTEVLLDQLVEVNSQISNMVYQITELSKVIWQLRKENTELKIKLNMTQLSSGTERFANADNSHIENNGIVFQSTSNDGDDTDGCDRSVGEVHVRDDQLILPKLNLDFMCEKEFHPKTKNKSIVLDVKQNKNNGKARSKSQKRAWTERELMNPIFIQLRKLYKKPIIYGHVRFAPKKLSKRKSNMCPLESKCNDVSEDSNEDRSPSESDGGQGGRLLD